MKRQSLAELLLAAAGRSPLAVRDAARTLGVKQAEVERALAELERDGLVRMVYDECRAKGCRGCRYHGRCEERHAVAYRLPPVEEKQRAEAKVRIRSAGA